jgi:ABC-type Fe3+-hydroxamate transport system substrate-binding protein
VRTRLLVLTAVLVAALSACSDDEKSSEPEPTASMTEVTVQCDRYADTAKKITDAQTALYSGTGGDEAIDTLVTELDGLKEGAPADVKAALTELTSAFEDAKVVLENPTPENKAKLADLAPKLSADGQKITAYITSKCG